MNQPATTVEEMAGQRLMLGFDGTRLNPELKKLIKEFHAGGLILFRPNIVSADQVQALCQEAQAVARDLGRPPLFIAVDQEGGKVARLRHPFEEYPGNPHIRTREEARAFARACGRQLVHLGINMNLAPVMDVAPKGVESIMKDRAFPGDAALVADLGATVIQTFQEMGIMAVAKHFPGIGRTVKDSHLTLPVLKADKQTLKASDLVPFEAAIQTEVAGVMLSHISYPLLDPAWQASLSLVIAQDLLRQELGYKGLVMTDDLDMKAICLDMETCMERVVRAGIDLALICHSGPAIPRAFQALCRVLEDPEHLDGARESMARIMAAKQRFLNEDRLLDKE